MTQQEEADPWAIEAAQLPLAFAQVREDPRLDLAVLRCLPAKASVMMVASAGETAVCLARENLQRLVLVDVNPAQLALTRCRFHLAEFYGPQRSMEMLGHLPMAELDRIAAWRDLFSQLALADDCLAPMESLGKNGADHCGRYEAAFAELRHFLRPCHTELLAFLQTHDPREAAQSIEPTTKLGQCLEHAFARALSLANLVRLFGVGATQNPRRPFHEHFIAQLRSISSRMAPAANPWIWQLLEGRFPSATAYDWLVDSRPIQLQPEMICSPMLCALEKADEASMDLIHLSNILDWLAPDDARHTLQAARRVIKPGGMLIIRQLNSSLDMAALDDTWQWDQEKGRQLQAIDRSFFYPEIHVARCP